MSEIKLNKLPSIFMLPNGRKSEIEGRKGSPTTTSKFSKGQQEVSLATPFSNWSPTIVNLNQ